MKNEIISLLKKYGFDHEIAALNGVPKESSMGDYALPCFPLVKKFKKNPVEIAREIAGKLGNATGFEKIEAVNGYVNFFVDKKKVAVEVLNKIEVEKDRYGASKEGKGKKIIVEFASPNTNKPLHLGHLRNISIGQSVSNILDFYKNKVIKTSINNDRGVHICKSMIAYEQFGNGTTPEKEGKKSDHFVGNYYVLFNKKAREDKNYEMMAQECLRKWEMNDKKTVELWKKMNAWALEGFKKTYKILGVVFDKEYYESKIYKKGKEIVELGLKKNMFSKKDDGAVVINLENEGFGEKVLLRSDGTSIYITQDLYLAKLRHDEFKMDGGIYVVANEQDYHFKVLFSILKKLGFKFADKLHHLSYGMVELPEGKMKSREGNVVDADDLIKNMQDLAKEELKKRYSLPKKELEERSLKITLAAIKYNLLKIDIAKNIVFNPREAIHFEGDTGPYLLYSYARARSILRKTGKKISGKFEVKEINDKERVLINELNGFPEVVAHAYNGFAPNLIANYAFSLAQTFNEFYHSSQVIGSDEESFRLKLVSCFAQVLKNALYLLGIGVVEEM